MKKEKCPKCNFYLTENYCVKCGYTKNIFSTNIKKYDSINEVELYLKDNYQKVVYNKNLLLIFILGPLYFSYFKFYILGFTLFIIEFMISYVINNLLSPYGLGIEPLVIFYFISRLFYLLFSNLLVLKLIKKKITTMKEKNRDLPKNACSLYSLAITIFLMLIFLFLFLIWYKIKNGTLTF